MKNLPPSTMESICHNRLVFLLTPLCQAENIPWASRKDAEKREMKNSVLWQKKLIWKSRSNWTRSWYISWFANQLEDLGANVLGGVFLGRTHYRYK